MRRGARGPPDNTQTARGQPSFSWHHSAPINCTLQLRLYGICRFVCRRAQFQGVCHPGQSDPANPALLLTVITSSLTVVHAVATPLLTHTAGTLAGTSPVPCPRGLARRAPSGCTTPSVCILGSSSATSAFARGSGGRCVLRSALAW